MRTRKRQRFEEELPVEGDAAPSEKALLANSMAPLRKMRMQQPASPPGWRQIMRGWETVEYSCVPLKGGGVTMRAIRCNMRKLHPRNFVEIEADVGLWWPEKLPRKNGRSKS